MWNLFRVVENPLDSPGFEGSSSSDSGNMAKYLDAFCGFRDEVRQLARAAADPFAILGACDKGTMVNIALTIVYIYDFVAL